MIQVDGLKKVYRVHRRPPGLLASVRSLFHREYSEVRAVDGISFRINPAERVGFLGPNGAGKTTTLKMLSGLLYPTSGDVRVSGFIPRERGVDFLRSITLVMGQKQQLLWDLPPADTFALNRAIYDIPKALFEETVRDLTELLGLEELVTKPTRQLSLGERMKCELAAALLHRPRVLFLDEPTIGLDVDMQVTVREFIKAYNERYGATVLLTSHYMQDVLALCPRIIVIDKGRLLFDGVLDELVRSVRPEKRLVLKLARPVDRNDALLLGEVIEHEPGRLVLQVRPERIQQAVGAAMAKLPVADLTVEDPPLEDVMRDLFERSRAQAHA
jgi:ABC-2 type transport system ATP-binding protein